MHNTSQLVSLSLDRRLVVHPAGLHLRQMRIAIWLYLYLRMQANGEAEFDVDPAAVAKQMGLKEGTVKSWLGHLRKGKYLQVRRVGQSVFVRFPTSSDQPPPARPASQFFTVRKLEDALGESRHPEMLETAVATYPERVIQRALAGALRMPEERIRKSRTALFLFLIKRYAQEDDEYKSPGD